MFDAAPLCSSFLPFPQSPAYAAAAQACGATVREIALDGGHALAIERSGLRLISRGPVWEEGLPPSDQRRALRHLARSARVTLVTPEADIRGFGMIPLVTPMHHAVWDLIGDMRARTDRKWRNHLSAAERKGFGFVRDRPGALERLLAAEAPQRGARGYHTLPAGFTRALPEAALRLWEWRHEGTVGAAMCFVRHGNTASYHMAWAGSAARERAIHGLMLWRAALALRDEGVRWLDLGSIDGEAAPGLARFKLGTGAQVRRLGATLLVLPG